MNCQYNSSSASENYLKRYHETLTEMISKMTEARLNDSISHNFIVQMIPHHRAAIEMSKNILRYTNNSSLMEIAKNIISEQTKSIENMRAILCCCSQHTNNCCDVKTYQCRVNQIMKVMFDDMGNAYSDNRIDCDFMREMIPHHMGAIRMSENALRYDICTELKPILKAIISSQEEGVCQMKMLLRELGCSC